jgi:hypothetical protein
MGAVVRATWAVSALRGSGRARVIRRRSDASAVRGRRGGRWTVWRAGGSLAWISGPRGTNRRSE